MKNPISRRALVTGGPLGLAACGTMDGAYFGKTDPPSTQRLVYLIGSEAGSLDPGKVTGGYERLIVAALFEGLTNPHPTTAQPVAALATHYDVNANFTQYTFYLRGHLKPKGVKLPNTDALASEYRSGSLPEDFSRGLSSPADRIPAHWSDGTVITAHDFVYSWRRVVDPMTATPQYGFYLFGVRNAEEINAGKLSPETLGVRALDDFTFQVDLVSPVSYFLQLTWSGILAIVPRRAIEAAQAHGTTSSWTQPAHMVTCGAFRLRERRPYERTVVSRNPHYYEAGLVRLDEITFIPVADAAAGLNLYRTNSAHAMTGDRLPPLFTSRVGRKKDAYSAPAFLHIHPFFNCKKPPLGNVLTPLRHEHGNRQGGNGRCFRERPGAREDVRCHGSTVFMSLRTKLWSRILGAGITTCFQTIPRPPVNCWPEPDFQMEFGQNGVQTGFRIPYSRPTATACPWPKFCSNSGAVTLIDPPRLCHPGVDRLYPYRGQRSICDRRRRMRGSSGTEIHFLGVWETGAPFVGRTERAEIRRNDQKANSEVQPDYTVEGIAASRRIPAPRMTTRPPLLFYGYAGPAKPYVRGRHEFLPCPSIQVRMDRHQVEAVMSVAVSRRHLFAERVL